MLPLLSCITQLLVVFYTTSSSLSLVLFKLDSTCRKRRKKIVLCLVNYARRSCRRVQSFWNALRSPMSTIFQLPGEMNKQDCRIRGLPRAGTVYVSAKRYLTRAVWRAISENEVIRPLGFDDSSVTGDRYKERLRHYLFPKLANNPFDMMFQRIGAPTLSNSSQTLIAPKASKQMGGDSADSLLCSDSRIKLFDLLRWNYLED